MNTGSITQIESAKSWLNARLRGVAGLLRMTPLSAELAICFAPPRVLGGRRGSSAGVHATRAGVAQRVVGGSGSRSGGDSIVPALRPMPLRLSGVAKRIPGSAERTHGRG
jgi:hypothetical protein